MKIKIQLFGQDCPPFFGKSKFYEKKKAKSLKKIEKHQAIISIHEAIVAECDKHLNENK